ncbi:MAG TPA: TIGR01777 family oxidoreductase [Verrucomicrobiae bacterium]|jgi:hypothetical protein
MNSKRIILAGGSGFLGLSLANELSARGYEVIILTRSASSQPGPIQRVSWDGRTLGQWARHLDGACAVVNLTGKSVNCRYTPEHRREIRESRVNSVKVMDEAILQCAQPPKALVQAGSLALYGDAGDRWCDETAPSGEGFPAETCLLWEQAFSAAQSPRTRRVVLRIGFALGKDGGALGVLAKLTKWFLGGTVASGRQYISWIHWSDLNQMFLSSIERDDVEGAFNATGPNPATNAEFMRELRQVLKRPWSPPAPVWAVKMGCRLMSTEASLALTGRRCVPRKFVENGFVFKFPELKPALADIFR